MKPGKFESTGEGTIFLDEIGLVPFHLQSKPFKCTSGAQL